MLALVGGKFATINDSGDSARVFVIDRSGETVSETVYADHARDVEALAQGNSLYSVWVGDIGDNRRVRESVLLSEVDISGEAGAKPLMRTLRVAYPEGSADAETLMRAPDGRLVIVTKGFLGGTLYATPHDTDGTLGADGLPVEMEELSSPGAMMPMATDGAFFPDGRHFLVRGYASMTLYTWPDLERVASQPLPSQRQGEGLGIDASGQVWVSSEGLHAEVLPVTLEGKIAEARAEVDEAPDPTAQSGAEKPAEAGDAGQSGGDEDESLMPWIVGGVIALVGLGYLATRRRNR